MSNLLKLKFSGRNEEAEAFIKNAEKEAILKLLEDAKKSVEEGMYQVDASMPSGEITLTIK
ncbi:hypothetical protein [Rahnella woolbedingensis]|uniref:Uncharacterized protein n=1 Tax=Rahnella woolbedingensis TaxID=1510574 RepID=A0A419NER0_9GAMM|nr:hypothetical protein [Rahnella woolbedingensis]RJT47242.1 hypothetical protein D6C13_02445 [Rahnella woolbedingensis]